MLFAKVRARAREARIRLTAALRRALPFLARRSRRKLMERLERYHRDFEQAHGLLPDSTPGIREERDRWG